VLVPSLTKDQVERGQVLAVPGSIAVAKAFRAEVYLLSAEEGGRQGPIFTGYRPQIYVRTTDITGTVALEGATSAQPGGIATITVRLAREVALEPRTRFAIREGGRTVGAGFVTEVLPE
jgi:elongation factor Tu